MNGRLLSQQDDQFDVGIHQQEIKLNQQLPKGIYLLKVTNNQTQSIKKFVVQH